MAGQGPNPEQILFGGLVLGGAVLLASHFGVGGYIEVLYHGFPQTAAQARTDLSALARLRQQSAANPSLLSEIDAREAAIRAQFPSVSAAVPTQTTQGSASSGGSPTSGAGSSSGPVWSSAAEAAATTTGVPLPADATAAEGSLLILSLYYFLGTHPNSSHTEAAAIRSAFPGVGPTGGYTWSQITRRWKQLRAALPWLNLPAVAPASPPGAPASSAAPGSSGPVFPGTLGAPPL
jgi:hypothetical protein